MKRVICIILVIMLLTVSCFAISSNQNTEDENEGVVSTTPPLKFAPPDSYNQSAHNPFVSGLSDYDNKTYSWISNRSDIFIIARGSNEILFYTIQPSLITMVVNGETTNTSFSCRDPVTINNKTYYVYLYPGNSWQQRARFNDVIEATYNNYESYVEAAFSSIEGNDFRYTLPPGNVIYLELGSNYKYLHLECIQPKLSALANLYDSNYLWWANQFIGYTDTLPSTNEEFNRTGWRILWEKNPVASVNVFGQTYEAIFNSNNVSPTGKYLFIYNPYYYFDSINQSISEEVTHNNSIDIYTSGILSAKVFSLTQSQHPSLDPTEPLGTDTNDNVWDGEIDVETGDVIWTNQNGDIENPYTGGGNTQTPSISGFESWLKTTLNNIVNLFAPAHSAIQTVGNAISNFGSWIAALYSWLPSPVYSLLVSAITIAIIIGVLKVFL